MSDWPGNTADGCKCHDNPAPFGPCPIHNPMSGDVGAEVAAALAAALRDGGWLDSIDAVDAARDIAPLIAARVEAAKADVGEQIARAIESEWAEWDALGGDRSPHPLHSPGWLVERAYANAASVARAALDPGARP